MPQVGPVIPDCAKAPTPHPTTTPLKKQHYQQAQEQNVAKVTVPLAPVTSSWYEP